MQDAPNGDAALLRERAVDNDPRCNGEAARRPCEILSGAANPRKLGENMKFLDDPREIALGDPWTGFRCKVGFDVVEVGLGLGEEKDLIASHMPG